jgi:shikimate dehydrogenase
VVWRTSSQKKLRNVELLEKKQLLKKPQRKKQPLKRHSLTDPVKKLFLVGKKLSHSFSPNYFKQKFLKENIVDWNYAALELDQIEKIEKLRAQIDLAGFNVTIPYKTSIMPFLDELDTDAKQIGAVNTVVPISKGDGIALKGYNTDKPAFMATLEPIKEQVIGAMVLGSGGAAKAVKAGLDDLKIHHVSISRTGQLRYKDIDSKLLKNYNLIVNCTPLGMFPDTTTCPELPYEMLNSSNILYDLVYNPALTTFLQKGKHKNCFCLNGLRMLEIQADLSFELWKKNLI